MTKAGNSTITPKNTTSSKQDEAMNGYGFGTFKGVFTPSILTILGVIMYLRFGWVLGNVGLAGTLIIVALSTAITLCTSLALASLATNMKVGGGGAYYIISRSLGLEPGAAIGIPLFFAQALGISFYVAGFTESLCSIFPSLSPVMVGLGTLIAITALAYYSASIALKLQFFIMIIIGASLISFFLGTSPTSEMIDIESAPDPMGFWYVFSVFFPAVTGIEAGISMSGDLKNPSRSLPVGTLGAVLTGYVIYIAIPVFLSITVHDPALLRANPMIMQDIAVIGELIVLGIWGAALSSAMGAMLGAPRTLQALAIDGVLPSFIGKSYGSTKDPRIATMIAFLVAAIGIVLGDLNAIASVLSMFFLASYGLLNLSAACEDLISSPTWRPTFRVPWQLNLLGALLCIFAMFMINAGTTFIAILISGTVYYGVKRKKIIAHWGDIRYGILSLIAERAIRELDHHTPSMRTWNPNLLVLSGTPTSRWYLIELAYAISRISSLVTIATVLPEQSSAERVSHTEQIIKDYLHKRAIPAIVKVVTAPDTVSGLEALVRAYGFGAISPNIVMLGETEREENFARYSGFIDLVIRRQKSIVIVRGGKEEPDLHAGSRIDIWWGGASNNPDLMLALAYLIQRSQGWSNCELMLKTIVSKNMLKRKQPTEQGLRDYLHKQRVIATPDVVAQRSENVFDDIRRTSSGADLVFLGMRSRGAEETLDDYRNYYENLLTMTEGLPPTAIVFAAENTDFSQLFND